MICSGPIARFLGLETSRFGLTLGAGRSSPFFSGELDADGLGSKPPRNLAALGERNERRFGLGDGDVYAWSSSEDVVTLRQPVLSSWSRPGFLGERGGAGRSSAAGRRVGCGGGTGRLKGRREGAAAGLGAGRRLGEESTGEVVVALAGRRVMGSALAGGRFALRTTRRARGMRVSSGARIAGVGREGLARSSGVVE